MIDPTQPKSGHAFTRAVGAPTGGYRRLIGAILVLGIATLGWTGRSLAGHPAAECQRYAQNAVRQLQDFTAAGCSPKPGVKMWSNDYNAHHRWCSTENGDLGQEFKKRRLAIESCRRHSDAECRKYADNAVAQTTSAIRNGCPNINPPRWTTDAKPHYDWCRADLDGDLGHEFKQRRLANETCLRNKPQVASLPVISAAIVINVNSQKILRVTGSGFTNNATVKVDYTWIQTGPASQKSGSGSFMTTASGSTINGEISVNCSVGLTTSYTNVTATDTISGKVSKPVAGGSC